jgi:hypothetical protein
MLTLILVGIILGIVGCFLSCKYGNPKWCLITFLSLFLLIPGYIGYSDIPKGINYKARICDCNQEQTIYFDSFIMDRGEIIIGEYYKNTANGWSFPMLKYEKFTNLLVNVKGEFRYNILDSVCNQVVKSN